MAKATYADAELILHLYELRTESLMRKARQFVTIDFWPQSFEDLQKIHAGFGTEQNAWWRQAMSYWEMAASFVVRDVVNEELFSDSASELFFLYAKYRAYIPQLRETSPTFMLNVEAVVNHSKENQERVERLAKTIQSRFGATATSHWPITRGR